jgi:hypothetical protein
MFFCWIWCCSLVQCAPWGSVADSNRPLRSEPSVRKVEKQRELAKRLEKSFPKAPETDHIRLASASPRALKRRPLMRRTLLAVGFAVLVAMLLAPDGDKYGVDGFGPFFSNYGLTTANPGDWYFGWLGTGIFYGTIGRVMIDMLILQTLFLAVLFAVLANLRQSWRPKPKQTS